MEEDFQAVDEFDTGTSQSATNWNDGLVDLLCSMHIPVLRQYNGYTKSQKDAVSRMLVSTAACHSAFIIALQMQHWNDVVAAFRAQGSKLSRHQIQGKFRKLKSAYTAVKDNNGRTGMSQKFSAAYLPTLNRSSSLYSLFFLPFPDL